MKPQGLGGSGTASAFGARINMTLPAHGMYLVTGRGSSLTRLISAVGGKVIFRVSDAKLLAILPVAQYLAIQHHPEIDFIGPVMLDRERFDHFAASLGLETNQTSDVVG